MAFDNSTAIPAGVGKNGATAHTQAVKASSIEVWAAFLGTLIVVSLGFGALASRQGMPSRDHIDFYLRVHEYDAEFRAGHWPQLLPDAVRGGGHAFPLLYPPLSHFAAAGIYRLDKDVVLAAHLSAMAAVLVGAAAMYTLLLTLTGQALPAMLSALTYSFLPYRATQLFIRGAFAEAWALAWYPFVLLGLLRWGRDGRLPGWWPLAVGAAILSHTGVSLWALPAMGLFALLSHGAPSRAGWGDLLLSSALALGLAACYLLPVLRHLPDVRAARSEWIAATPAAIGSSVGSWRFPGPLVAAELVIVLGAFLLILRSYRESTPTWNRTIGWALLGQALFVSMSVAPESFWHVVPQPWRYLQFGWRLLGPAALMISLGIGLLAAGFRSRVGQWTIVGLIALMAVVGGGQTRRSALRDPTVTDRSVLREIRGAYSDLGFTLHGEYLPREANPESLGTMIARTREGLRQAGSEGRGQPGEVLRLTGTHSAEEIALPLVAYDLFQAIDQDGRSLDTGSRAGQLTVVTTDQTREVRVRRRMAPTLTLGLLISGISALIVGLRALQILRPPAGPRARWLRAQCTG